MLCYKAWLESRIRFMITALTIIGFCLFAVFFNRRMQAAGVFFAPDLRANTYSKHIYDLIYSGTAKGVFAMLTIFLGLGGLLRERSQRTAVFTLALPVSRWQVVSSQLAVAVGQLALLALLPATLLPSLSAAVHQSYPVTEALHFSVLWFGCGSIILAFAFLLSVSLPGEYTAPLVCYIALMLQTLVALWRPLKPYRLNLLWTMGEFETMHWDVQRHLLVAGSMPWARLSAIMLIACAMLALAVRITYRQDF
jgi:ABC-2 type transport system permease protein